MIENIYHGYIPSHQVRQHLTVPAMKLYINGDDDDNDGDDDDEVGQFILRRTVWVYGIANELLDQFITRHTGQLETKLCPFSQICHVLARL